MATLDFTKYSLYRWRYVIGYSVVGLLLTALLIFAGLYLPGGLMEYEKTAVIRSESLTLLQPLTWAIPNLPYYALQAGIFELFGVTIFTIKLPSLILALLSAVGFIILLRRWFKPNIAVLASLIAISTGQFLYIAQSGYPGILYIFWPIVLLLLGTQVTRVKKLRFLWKALFAVAAALSLYTPLGVYTLLAIGLAVISHPHLRAVIRRMKKVRLGMVLIVFAAVLVPLVYLIVTTPQLGLTLLGVPTVWPPDLGQNALSILRQYFLFWDPSITAVMTPVFGLGSVMLIGLGLYRLIRTRETTRSYLIIFWFVTLIPVLLLNPLFTSITFVPLMLMLAAGLTSLISYWYRLFPLNPYARIAGLLPTILLVGVLILTGLTRYVYGYHYSQTVAPLFSKDLALLPKDAGQLVVAGSEAAFYKAVAVYRDPLEVVDTPTAMSFVATRDARQDFPGYEITRVITNAHRTESDRLYVYQKTGQ